MRYLNYILIPAGTILAISESPFFPWSNFVGLGAVSLCIYLSQRWQGRRPGLRYAHDTRVYRLVPWVDQVSPAHHAAARYRIIIIAAAFLSLMAVLSAGYIIIRLCQALPGGALQ